MLQFQILLIFVLLAFSATFSATETALFGLRRKDIAELQQENSSTSKRILMYLAFPRYLLTTMLMSNDLVNVAISIIVAGLVNSFMVESSFSVKTLVASAVSIPILLTFGEVLPKNIGMKKPQKVLHQTMPWLHFLSTMLTYPRKALSWLSDRFIIWFGGDPKVLKPTMMEHEFRALVDMGYDEGTIEDAEVELIHGVFELGDATIDSIMVPIEEVFKFHIDEEMDKLKQELKETQFSRIPVYDQDSADIIGILHVRDLSSTPRAHHVSKLSELEDMIRPAFFVSKSANIEQLLKEFQSRRVHMGVVYGEHQKVCGIVTMDDILKYLFEEGEEHRD